jgi:hypothetical protein
MVRTGWVKRIWSEQAGCRGNGANRMGAEEIERTGWVQKKWREQAGCRRNGENRLGAEEMGRTGWAQKKWSEQAGCRRNGANRLGAQDMGARALPRLQGEFEHIISSLLNESNSHVERSIFYRGLFSDFFNIETIQRRKL